MKNNKHIQYHKNGDVSVDPLYLIDKNFKPKKNKDKLEIERLRAALRKIDIKAEAGLCYFTLGAARAFHQDIRTIVADCLSSTDGEKQS